MIDAESPMIEFSTFDRCDRCGAQALTVAQQDGKADLLFCFHHRKENYDALIDSGWTVVDDYEAIENLAYI